MEVIPPGPAFPLDPSDHDQPTKFLTDPDPSATGGVYVLVDPESGRVVRTGRTNDFDRRAAEHGDTYDEGYEFVEVYKTDDINAQVGLEQRLYDQNPLAEGVLNNVQPIGTSAAGWPLFSDAADDWLRRFPL